MPTRKFDRNTRGVNEARPENSLLPLPEASAFPGNAGLTSQPSTFNAIFCLLHDLCHSLTVRWNAWTGLFGSAWAMSSWNVVIA